MATGRLIDRSAFLARPRAFFMMLWRPPVSLAQDASVVALCSRVAIRTAERSTRLRAHRVGGPKGFGQRLTCLSPG